MLELSLEQMKRLADIVYQDKTWWTHDIREDGNCNVYGMVNGIATRFNPKLDGAERERLQALDVIVAAHELCKFNMEARAEFEHALGDGIINDRHDLLHASALALLGDKT